MPDIIPLPGCVVLLPIEAREKTEAGLWRPDSAQEQLPQGEVVAVGAVINKMPFAYKELPKKGEVVVYKKYGDQDYSLKGLDYKLVPFNQLIAIVKE